MDKWSGLNFFSKTENWGDPDKISFDLLKELDAFRSIIGTEILITCGTQGQHISKSYHYLGLAVDIMFPKQPLTELPNLFFTALRFKFSGLGIYPHWQLSGIKRGGLHLDMRPTERKSTWIGLPEKTYLPVKINTLIQHF